MQMLTIAEAARLTGKHPDTIRRLIKRSLKEDGNSENNIKQELVNGGFSYRIAKDYLLKHIQVPSATVEMPTQERMQADVYTKFVDGQQTPQDKIYQSKQPHVGMQTDTQTNSMQGQHANVQLLRETIEILKGQLKEKDKQIEQLLDRGRETNILLKGYQDRYFLEAPKEREAEKPVVETATATPQAGQKPRPQKPKSKKSDQQKRRGFFSFLRGK